MHVLFVCSRNKKRSLTAEMHFAGSDRFEVASAGLNRDSEVTVTADLIDWADVIFVMEGSHRTKLQNRFRSRLPGKRVICLDIADRFECMDPRLIAELERKVARYL
jgi:predicted protein tyrosine phosphatase